MAKDGAQSNRIGLAGVGEVDLVVTATKCPAARGDELVVQARDGGRLVDLEVDGGVDLASAPKAVAAGANVLVAGTCIFADPGGPAAGVRKLRAALASP